MRKVINLVLILGLCLPSASWAKCDFSTGITPGPNNTFIYSEECHKQVGVLVQQNKVQQAQITDYVKAISMKDLAIQASDNRATLWMNTSASLEDRLQKVDKLQKDNEWLYFGLGVATTFLAGIAAAKIAGR